MSDINALVDESLNRAYYGERAETRGFTIKLEKSFDLAVGEVDLFPREISRAILNLIRTASTRQASARRQGKMVTSRFSSPQRETLATVSKFESGIMGPVFRRT